MNAKIVTIDVDYMGDKEDAKYESQMFGIKIVVNDNYDQADVSGTKSNILNWLMDVHHSGESEEELVELYEELS